ncbi:hypothetical protein [Janibacter indicus]|uniref:hypothetical protein n=1 Tax=Janibacter indicus TaxID=857417 RepID=UPI003D9A1418
MSERTEVRPPAGETEGQKITRATRSLDVKITADLAARARRHDHGVLVLAERRDGSTIQPMTDLGLLVARNVEKKDSAHRPVSIETGAKVSARHFAEQSTTSVTRVLRYLEAWNRATQAGHVPAASGGGGR